MEPGEARMRNRHWRLDATNRCCTCASWCSWVQRYHPIHCGARTTVHQQETITQHPHAAADHGRKSHRTTTQSQNIISNLPTSSSRFKSGKQMNGAFQNHERDPWTSSRGHQPRGDSTTWNIVDDQTVEASRTQHVVRAIRGILRHLSREFGNF